MISTLKIVGLRLIIFIVALGMPFLAVVMITGHAPSSFDVTELDAWSPVRSPGPSTTLLARGITVLIGIDRRTFPPWFTDEYQNLLTKAKDSLAHNSFQEAMGHLLILSDQLESQGKNLEDFLPIIVPDLATWLISHYFAPLVLAILFMLVGLFIFGSWLAKRFYDFVKILITLIVSLVLFVGGVSLCFTLARHDALVFTMIEYLTVVLVLLVCGNLMVYWWTRGRARTSSTSQKSLTSHHTLPIPETYQREASFTLTPDREFYPHPSLSVTTDLIPFRPGDRSKSLNRK